MDLVTYTSVLPQPGMTVYGDSFLANIGGKGANQACAIKLLGGDVEFFGSIGDDSNGKTVQNFVKTFQLAANLKISKCSTGIATIIVDNNTGENRIVIVPGANFDITKGDIDHLNFNDKDILLLQLENTTESVIYAMRKAKEKGLLVVFNPAPYHELPDSAFQYIDYLIPNEHELEQFTPNIHGNYEAKAKYLLNKGVKNVIVTLGENGSLLVNKQQVMHIEPFKVNAIDTTAAGDCYCGAFVTALSEGKDVIEAMRFARKASSIAVTRKGAISSLPKRDELE